MSNPTVILNGDQVYCDELIRENARLTIQHEADRLTLEQMRKQCVSSEECTAKVAEAYARADKAKRDAEALNSKLRQAIADLHFGVERTVLICDFERTVPALLPQPGDRDGQKAPP